jgi:hypothetical protein
MLLLVVGLAAQPPAIAQESEHVELARQLANPLAALISVPLQINLDENFGPDDQGDSLRFNFQPVIPISIGENWNLISRTILPIVDQNNVPSVGDSEFGLGDTVQSFFFSPKSPTASGWIWGVGPALLLPTGSDPTLGSEKWGIGPTAVALRQAGPWTYGALVNHIESFAGDSDRSHVSSTFIQPFLSYITSTKTTFSLNTESTYLWDGREWSIPINFNVSQMLLIGKRPVQIGAGVRYWAESSTLGAEGWGFRLQITLLFPK